MPFDLLSWFCILLGGFLLVTGGVGVLRLPDFFSRVHAAGITETLATPLILIGLMFQVGPTLESVKLFLVIVFVMATSPSATHAMARAALHGGEGPNPDSILEPGSKSDPTRETTSSKT